ncbi:F-box protein At5g49610-like [Triticum aestivum]|uniref:F-box protein At5g49610-like n=1 Tax=Triticum aestivum TaxID=4565 RepID=UPI00084322F2|nr:F-box protein At5g49610-like [Triticum aestivum]
MAKMRMVAQISTQRGRRRILVASLLTRSPTYAAGAEQGAATDDDGVTIEREAAGDPVVRRTRSRCRAAALDRLPEDIVVWEILVRLPARDILRCRAVCRSWRSLASAPDFLLAHHRRQPSLPLVVLYGSAASSSTEAAGQQVLGQGRCRPVLGFDDYDRWKLHASCDGLLLLSLSDGRFSVCNPATRQCVSLPALTAAGDINVAALYLHCQSGEYRVLYWEAAAYYILNVRVRRRVSPRCIGVPSDRPDMVAMLAGHGTSPINLASPVVFRNHLHWEPDDCDHFDVGIVIFDTVVESFRSMCRPTATGFCMRLWDMEGSIGFSCLDSRRSSSKIWVLEDYEREVWSFKYHVKHPEEVLCHSVNTRHPAVVFWHRVNTRHCVLSHEGDLLVYNMSARYMFHYDSTGKLLEEFKWEPLSGNLSIIGHKYKESLVKHKFFPKRDAASPDKKSLFQWV